MTSLLDIAPPEVACKNINIVRGDRTDILTVYGLSALDIAKLIKRYPNFRLAAAGKQLSDDELMDMGIDVTPCLIAMGLRSQDPKTEKLVAERLSLDEQSRLVEAIMELTNPDAPRKSAIPPQEARAARRGGASGGDQAGTSP